MPGRQLADVGRAEQQADHCGRGRSGRADRRAACGCRRGPARMSPMVSQQLQVTLVDIRPCGELGTGCNVQVADQAPGRAHTQYHVRRLQASSSAPATSSREHSPACRTHQSAGTFRASRRDTRGPGVPASPRRPARRPGYDTGMPAAVVRHRPVRRQTATLGRSPSALHRESSRTTPSGSRARPGAQGPYLGADASMGRPVPAPGNTISVAELLAVAFAQRRRHDIA